MTDIYFLRGSKHSEFNERNMNNKILAFAPDSVRIIIETKHHASSLFSAVSENSVVVFRNESKTVTKQQIIVMFQELKSLMEGFQSLNSPK